VVELTEPEAFLYSGGRVSSCWALRWQSGQSFLSGAGLLQRENKSGGLESLFGASLLLKKGSRCLLGVSFLRWRSSYYGGRSILGGGVALVERN